MKIVTYLGQICIFIVVIELYLGKTNKDKTDVMC